MAETDAVALRDVRFSYPGASVAALDGLSLELPRTGLILVTGPVGAGASTLLQLLAGLVPHVVPGELSGVARVLGRDVAQRETHRQLAGAVSLLLPTPWVQLSGMAFTVFDETAFGPANLGWRRDVIREAVTAELERLGVSHLTGRDPATLSGGELQRVMLAAALVTRPSILLLDEPAIEIDDAGRGLLCELLCNECVERLVVMATTDVDSFGSLA
ncbi:MAG: ABC transporter ATP-binding protein, partial [Gemmatimonadales bacterium]